MQQIQHWVKESFKQRPFSLVNVVDWTIPPARSVPLMKVYTPPMLLRINRMPCQDEEEIVDIVEEVVDIANIFNGEQFGRNGPIRIFFQG